MAYWIIAATFSGLIGYAVATRYRVDGRAGFLLGLAFSTLFGTGLYDRLGRYEPTMQWALLAFGLLICLTFLLLQERSTSIALSKISALTFLVSVIFQMIAPSEVGLRRAEESLVQAADAATLPVDGVRSVLERTAAQAMEFSVRFPEHGGGTLAQAKRDARLFQLEDGRLEPSSKLVPSGTWAFVTSEAADTPGGRFVQVELEEEDELSEEGPAVGFVSESDLGPIITLPEKD